MSIRWSKSDYITLGKAVSQFNKKRNKLLTDENKLILPEKQSYQDIKSNIRTRKALNNVIKDLKNFLKERTREHY